MKKHLTMAAALMMGILMAFSSCKDAKTAGSNSDNSEQTDGPKKLTKITSAADLDNIDVDNIDTESLKKLEDLEGLDDIDPATLTEKQANNLLKVMMLVANKELPSDEGDGMTLKEVAMEGSDVNFTLEMSKEALQGVPISMFDMIFNDAGMKQAMMTEMVNGMTGDDEDMAMFMKVIIAAKKNFCMKFVDAESGEAATCRLEGAEMAKLMKDGAKADAAEE